MENLLAVSEYVEEKERWKWREEKQNSNNNTILLNNHGQTLDEESLSVLYCTKEKKGKEGPPQHPALLHISPSNTKSPHTLISWLLA